MGLMITSLWDSMYGSGEPVRILMVGLDAAGKTTILYKLKLGEVVSTIPTIGFNVETVQYKNISFSVWDVGGQDKIRRLWKHYYENATAIIFVIDSNDVERIDEARKELHTMLESDELKGSHLLIFANKQDLPRALKQDVLVERLGLKELKGREWFVKTCVGSEGEGLYEGLDWLVNKVNKK